MRERSKANENQYKSFETSILVLVGVTANFIKSDYTDRFFKVEKLFLLFTSAVDVCMKSHNEKYDRFTELIAMFPRV